MGRNPLEMQALDVSGRVLSGPDGSGGGGIRTHGRLAPTTVFKTVAPSPQVEAPQESRSNKRSLAPSLRSEPLKHPPT